MNEHPVLKQYKMTCFDPNEKDYIKLKWILIIRAKKLKHVMYVVKRAPQVGTLERLLVKHAKYILIRFIKLEFSFIKINFRNSS